MSINFNRQTVSSTESGPIEKPARRVEVTIMVDAECLLFCDEEYMDCELPAKVLTKVGLPEGDHVLTFHDKNDPEIHLALEVSIPKKKLYMVNGLKKEFDNQRKERAESEHSESEAIFREAISNFLNSEDKVLEDWEMEQLEQVRESLGLDSKTARRLIVEIRDSLKRQDEQKTVPSTSTAIDVDAMIAAIEANDVALVKSLLSQWKSSVSSVKHDDSLYNTVLCLYYMAYASLEPQKLIQEQENAFTDNYWRIYWAYIAYAKNNRKEKAEDLLPLLRQFDKYNVDNITILETISALNESGPESALSLFEKKAANDYYSSELDIVVKELLQEIGRKTRTSPGTKNSFVNENVLWFDDPDAKEKRRAEEEARRKAKVEEEKRLKAKEEAERKAREEAERKAKEAAERRAREAEEARLMREKADHEMKMQKLKAELEREKIQKEHEAAEKLAAEKAALLKTKAEAERLEREEEARKDALRKKITYTLKITSVNNQIQAMMTSRQLLGWDVATFRKKVGSLPIEVKVSNSEDDVSGLLKKLQDGGFSATLSGVNGLGEPWSDLVEVILMSKGRGSLQVIKYIQKTLGLSLAEAKDLVDSAPGVIIKKVSKEEAEQIKVALEKYGAVVEFK